LLVCDFRRASGRRLHMVLGVDVLLAALHARQEHAGLKARGAEQGLLRDGDAFEREELLRVAGPVSGDEAVLETGDFFQVFETERAEGSGVEGVLAGVLGRPGLALGARGPVERWALALLAASCFSEMEGMTCVLSVLGIEGVCWAGRVTGVGGERKWVVFDRTSSKPLAGSRRRLVDRRLDKYFSRRRFYRPARRRDGSRCGRQE